MGGDRERGHARPHRRIRDRRTRRAPLRERRRSGSVEAPRYTVVKLGQLAGDEYALPFGINAAGDVVGYSGGQVLLPTPFVYTDARGMRRLRLPDGATRRHGPRHQRRRLRHRACHALAGERRGALWRPNGRLRLLGSLGQPGDSSYGYGINADGAVAGWSYIDQSEFGGQEAFRWTAEDGMVSVTPGARPAFGHDINDIGDVSGEYEYEAFRTDGDEIVDISSGLAGVTTGEAINALGQVAITQERPDANDAWRWSPGIGLTDLGLAATDARVFAHGINASGDVVGRGRPVTSPNVAGGYLFRDGLGSLDLNELLIRRHQHWYISEAWDINDSGQIVAFATNLRTFEWEAVRLDPRP